MKANICQTAGGFVPFVGPTAAAAQASKSANIAALHFDAERKNSITLRTSRPPQILACPSPGTLAGDGVLMHQPSFGKLSHLILKIKLQVKSAPIVTITAPVQCHLRRRKPQEKTFMMVRNLRFAALAAISLLSLSFEATPAAAGGFWENGCCGAVLVQPMPVAPSCSCCCGTANYARPIFGGYGAGYGPEYHGGYGVGYGAGYPGRYGGGYQVGYEPEYQGGYDAGYGGYNGGYAPDYYGGYHRGLYRGAAYRGGGLYRGAAYRVGR